MRILPTYRRWLWCLLLVPIAVGLLRVRFDVEVLNLLPAHLPAVKGLKLYQENFSNARELIISVRAPDAEGAEQSARAVAETLRQATNLVEQAIWQPLWQEHPRQIAELVAYLWLNQSPMEFARLTNHLAPGNLRPVLHQTREALATSFSPSEIGRLAYDPYHLMEVPGSEAQGASNFADGQELFSSADGYFRILYVHARPDLAGYKECRSWLASIQDLIQKARGQGHISPDVVIHYTGRPAFVSEIAGGMQRDITNSAGGTLLVIILLFWWAHRRWKPLLWLLALLALILLATLALGGLIYGKLNVVSIGFAAILLGLAVDYGLVLYQEAIASPKTPAQDIRRGVAPSIAWAAVTTAVAFAILNLSALPGLAQLGSLVAIGITLAAFVMLSFYLPPLLRKEQPSPPGIDPEAAPDMPKRGPQTGGQPNFSRRYLHLTGLLLAVAAFILVQGVPELESSPDPLRPRNSPAYAAVEEIKAEMGRQQEPLWVLTVGRSEPEILKRLEQLEVELEQAKSNGYIARFTLPKALWPHTPFQKTNRHALPLLLEQREVLINTALSEGFTSNSLQLTEAVFNTWQAAVSQPLPFWPTNENSRWIIEKFLARPDNEFLVMGMVYPETAHAHDKNSQSLLELAERLQQQGAWLSGWSLLGTSVFQQVKKDFWRVLIPMILILLLSLWFAFRKLAEILLSLLCLAFGSVCLLMVMKVAGWNWNLLNLMAVPLLLGAGVDYSIHVQLALRRHHGNIRQVNRTVGRALWLCGATTIAGFGSNAWASNAGMASLGQVCATGIASVMLTAIYLLPTWWHAAQRRVNKE